MKNEQITGEALARVLPSYDRPWWRVRHLLQLNLILIVPLLSSATAGYDGSLVNGIQSIDAWKTYFGNPIGARLGLVTAGQAIGCLGILPFVAVLSDRYGRKRTLAAGLGVVVVASVIMASSVNYTMLIISRIIVGWGGMLITQPSPMLISELAYPLYRGKLTSMFWTGYYVGAILSAWSSYGAQKHLSDSDWSWRIPCVLQAGFPLLQLISVFLVPESPRWLSANSVSVSQLSIVAEHSLWNASNDC